MDAVTLVNCSLETSYNEDLAYCNAIGLWTDMIECSKNNRMLKNMYTTKKDFLKKMTDNYKMLVRKHELKEEYKNIFETVLDYRDDIRLFVLNNQNISDDMKNYICQNHLNCSLYD
jgi:hypothetical protein